MCHNRTARVTGGVSVPSANGLHFARSCSESFRPLSASSMWLMWPAAEPSAETYRRECHTRSQHVPLHVLFAARILSLDPEVFGQGKKCYLQTGPSTPCVDWSCSVVFDWTSQASYEGRLTDPMQTPTHGEHV